MQRTGLSALDAVAFYLKSLGACCGSCVGVCTPIDANVVQHIMARDLPNSLGLPPNLVGRMWAWAAISQVVCGGPPMPLSG